MLSTHRSECTSYSVAVAFVSMSTSPKRYAKKCACGPSTCWLICKSQQSAYGLCLDVLENASVVCGRPNISQRRSNVTYHLWRREEEGSGLNGTAACGVRSYGDANNEHFPAWIQRAAIIQHLGTKLKAMRSSRGNAG